MFLKIQYGSTNSKYFTKFTSVDFTSHLSEEAPVVNVSQLNSNVDLLITNDFLEDEKGCCHHEDQEDTYYLNEVILTLDRYQEDGTPFRKCVYYSGNAYLCNEEGKTVDILR